MKRTITRKRSESKFQFILTSDWHLRDNVPACREHEEYLEAQEHKLAFISKICQENNATLLIAGDIWDHWKPSPWLISLALRYIPAGTIVVPGQHDMPGHNIQELSKTGLQTLQEAGAVIILSGGLRRDVEGSGSVFGYAYGEKVQNSPKDSRGLKILLWHRLTCHATQPWPGAEAVEANKKNMMGFDIVISGDNHMSFVCGNWINPGSIMRMASDQKDFCPAIYGWSEDGSITRIPLPIKKDVVKMTTRPTEEKASRDERMEAYITRARRQFEDRLSFDKNLENHFKNNKERNDVEKCVWSAVER